MGRPKKTETVEKIENKKENKKEKVFYKVVKTLKNGSVVMITGYDKEINND